MNTQNKIIAVTQVLFFLFYTRVLSPFILNLLFRGENIVRVGEKNRAQSVTN